MSTAMSSNALQVSSVSVALSAPSSSLLNVMMSALVGVGAA